ncbi:dnaJ (Hsp40) homolog, subfamily C, member 30b [Pholidichthys leucotaenia]
MAEVGRRVGSGVYKLSGFSFSQGRSLSAGGSPGCLLKNCGFIYGQSQHAPVQDQLDFPRVLKSRELESEPEKLDTVRKIESRQENVAFSLDSSTGLTSSCFTGVVPTGPWSSSGLLQERLVPYRRTCCTRPPVSIHPDTLRSPQQLRALCTAVFFLSYQKRLKASFTTRSYSWRAEDAPLLHRSKTAYYDILKVSPSASQSQIKTAYYKQSFIYHPDKNSGSKEATQRFSDISEAYTVLGNISLRRKYDRGILSLADIQGAGRPSSKEASSRSAASHQQQQHQQRARRFSHIGGRPIFDFDAFYQGHYGEQLQRERELRARKKYKEEMQKELSSKWKQKKMMEMTVVMMLAMAGFLLISTKCIS